MRIAPAATAATSLLLIGSVLLAPAATATGGSDAATPYDVSSHGLTLPDGATFADGGHVNIRFTTPDGTEDSASIHFESQNDQASGEFVGERYLPWSQLIDADGYCVTWVQVGGYDEHFGEGGQKPVCSDSEPPQEPTPSDEPVVPSQEPTEPSEDVTPSPAAEPTEAADDSASPSPSAGADVAGADDGQLAATGATVGAAALFAALLAAGGAAIIVLTRRARQN